MGLFSRMKWLEESVRDSHDKNYRLQKELKDLKQIVYKDKIDKKLKEYSEKYGRNITMELRASGDTVANFLCIDLKAAAVLSTDSYEKTFSELIKAESEIKSWLFDEKTKYGTCPL